MSHSNAVIKRDADSALMPPPLPPLKRIKRAPKVLDQDQYERAISAIIARDFFPTLLTNDAVSGYLDARDSGVYEWIAEAGDSLLDALGSHRNREGLLISLQERALAARETPNGPRARTPSSIALPDGGKNINKASVRTNTRLGTFQQNYTSEDNESFHKIIDKQNKKNMDRHKWLWNGNKLDSDRSVRRIGHDLKPEDSTMVETMSGKTNSDISVRPSQNNDDRPAGVQLRYATPRNGLMFVPNDFSDMYPDFESMEHTNQASSRAPAKSINYNATRIEPLNELSEGRPPSPTISKIDRAIRNRPGLVVGSDVTTSVADSENSSETPRVNGYAYVDAEPSKLELDAHEKSQMTLPNETHSDLEIQHNLLTRLRKAYGEGPYDSHSQFKLQDSTKREALHNRMLAKQLASNRTPNDRSISQAGYTDSVMGIFSDRTGRTGNRAPSTSLSCKAGRALTKDATNMTPAARVLLEKVEKTAQGRRSFEPGSGTFGRPTKRSRGATPSWTPATIRARRIDQ